MNTPNLSCKIEVFCTINPSESIEKVEQTISNIFPYSVIKNNEYTINAISKELRSFEKIYHFVHNNKLEKNFLRSLEDNLENDTTCFILINKLHLLNKLQFVRNLMNLHWDQLKSL